jgi:hypothetical protein
MLKVLIPALLFSSVLFAEDAPKVEAAKNEVIVQRAGYNFGGLSLGISRPTGSNSSGIPIRFNYEFQGSHALSKEFAVGAFVSRNNGPISQNSSINVSYTRVGAQAIYNPTHDSFIDLRTGVGFIKAEAKVANSIYVSSDSIHSFFVGTGFGVIVPIMDKLQFTPSLHYSWFIKNTDIQTYEMFDVMLGLRYQF